MPLYDYACSKCGHTLEVRHGFDESYDKPCPRCGAPVRRVFNAAPVLFKGSGFYVTDSRRAIGRARRTRSPRAMSAPLPRPKTEKSEKKPAEPAA